MRAARARVRARTRERDGPRTSAGAAGAVVRSRATFFAASAVRSAMQFPRLTTVEGAYSYFMGLLVGLALLLLAYVAAVYVGVAPGPTGILPV